MAYLNGVWSSVDVRMDNKKTRVFFKKLDYKLQTS